MEREREGKIETGGEATEAASTLPGRTLTALTTSALALPGLALPARADTPIEQATARYGFSWYKEDNLASNKKVANGGGSSTRYEVLTHQFEVDMPVSNRMDAGLDFLYEKMSGASPWYVQAVGNERLQVMSGATIDDTRYDLSGNLNYYLEDAKDTFSAGMSKEQDYLSVHGGLGTERSYFDKNTTLSASGSFAYDWIDPNNPNTTTPARRSGEKWSVDVFAGISQLLSRSTAIQGTFNYKHSDGYLSDPYKLISVLNGANIADSRPGVKDQFSYMMRLRQHIEPIAASVHLDYQLYHDDWSVTSHMVELSWHQSLFDVLTITPGVRYYSQSKAKFYDTVLPVGSTVNAPKNHSSDFRLSPYGAISWKVKAELSLDDLFEYRSSPTAEKLGVSGGLDLFAALSYERYISDGAFAIVKVKSVDEAPALVAFQVIALTISGRF